MKLLNEMIEYAVAQKILSETQADQLKKLVFNKTMPYPLEVNDKETRTVKRPLLPEEDATESFGAAPRFHSPKIRGKSGGKKGGRRPAIDMSRLDTLVGRELDSLYAETPFIVKMRTFWESLNDSKTSPVERVRRLGEGELTLNDLYAVALMTLKDDYWKDYSGSSPLTYLQALHCSDNETIVGSRKRLVQFPRLSEALQFHRFQKELFHAASALYRTDWNAFSRLSDQNGRLPVDGWERTKRLDTTSLKVWSLLSLYRENIYWRDAEETISYLTHSSVAAIALRLEPEITEALLNGDCPHLDIRALNGRKVSRFPAPGTMMRTILEWEENPPEDGYFTITDVKSLTDVEWKYLAELSELRLLDLEDSNITDAELMNLVYFARLKELDLSGTSITDKGLPHLTGLKKLQKLSLAITNITDAGLIHIAQLTQLRVLILAAQHITGTGLVHLAQLKQLQILDLGWTSVSNDGLDHLARLPKLQTLSLLSTDISNKSLAHLADLTQLQELVLSCTNISDAGLAHLAQLTQLKKLKLVCTSVTGSGVAFLKKALPHCCLWH